MTGDKFDLIIQAGRVICPSSAFDAPGAVAIRGQRIVAVGEKLATGSADVLGFPNAILLPGLIDLHAHPACSGSVFGVNPDEHLLQRGTTTVLSQGDAGARNMAQYVEETILASKTHVRLAINISAIGESTEAGCCANPLDVDVPACIEAIERFREHIWGVAVNTSQHACETTDPKFVLQCGLKVAEATGQPLLYGMRAPEDWPLHQQLEVLRPGDVVTYSYRRRPHCVVSDGKLLPEIREANERGIRFDVGHGMASFDFGVAETAIRNGLLPYTISTDLQKRHLDCSPTHDLPLVMSKLAAVGMPEKELFAAVTARSAHVLGLDDVIGSLKPGACADMTLLEQGANQSTFRDTAGNTRKGLPYQVVLTIRAGEIVQPVEDQPF